MNLGGVMFWAIDIDDFTGTHCDQGLFPLINTVKKYFEENKSKQPTTPIIKPAVENYSETSTDISTVKITNHQNTGN